MKVSDVSTDARLISPGNPRRRPKISVVTPTYKRNAEGLLRRALDSALVQTFADFEHIVVDDGSDDGTEETVRDYAARDDRIVYVRYDRNSGLPAVRTNEGILRARGEAVAFLFDDNVYEPDFLQRAWEGLQDSGADVVHAEVEFPRPVGGNVQLGGFPTTLELLRSLNTIANGGVLCRRSFFDRFGLYDPHVVLRRVSDWDLWLRALSLGATFQRLDFTGGTEFGMVSPNSLGATVATDWKVSHGWLQDSARYAERTAKLLPSTIADYDVLDTTPLAPYVRDDAEWAQAAEIFYKPFLDKNPRKGFEPTLTSNRSAGVDPLDGWNAEWSVTKRRFRVAVVSNTGNPWASLWVRSLQAVPGAIVVHCPDWQLASYPPPALDMIVLLDSSLVYLAPVLAAQRAAGVPILYALGYGGQPGSNEPRAALEARSDRQVERLLNDAHLYFPRSGQGFAGEDTLAARELLAHCDVLIADADEAAVAGLDPDSLNGQGARLHRVPRPAFPVPSLRAPAMKPACAVYPRDDLEVSLGSLTETRPGWSILTEQSVLDRAPFAERVGLGAAAADFDVDVWGADEPQALDEDGCDRALLRGQDARVWGGWIADLGRMARLQKLIASARGRSIRPLRVAIFLHSELLAGSEVYGMMMGQLLHRLGAEVRFFIPERSVYELGRIDVNDWLAERGLPLVEHAPYTPGSSVNWSDWDRNFFVSRLHPFLQERDPDIVFCSGYMGVFGEIPAEGRLLVKVMYSLAAYDHREFRALRGKVSGVTSDSWWATAPCAAGMGAPGRAIRFPMPPAAPHLVKDPARRDRSQPVRIGVAGTLQPRKRQLEAIQAVGLLLDQGYNVELNFYGYALKMMQFYIDVIDETLAGDPRLQAAVTMHGFVESVDQITHENDVILSGSTDESLPTGVSMQMNRGLVTCVALVGGIDELVIDGVTGYLTRDSSPRGLAAMLKRALDEEDRWPEVVAAARAHLDDEFSVTKASAELLEFFYDVASQESGFGGHLRG